MNTHALDIVYRLARQNQPVAFSSIPGPLADDFLRFMTGRAFVKRSGEFQVYPSDFRDWIYKITTRGIDHELNLS